MRIYQKRVQEVKRSQKRLIQGNISMKALGSDHPDVATGLNNLAELYSAQGQYAPAEPGDRNHVLRAAAKVMVSVSLQHSRKPSPVASRPSKNLSGPRLMSYLFASLSIFRSALAAASRTSGDLSVRASCSAGMAGVAPLPISPRHRAATARASA